MKDFIMCETCKFSKLEYLQSGDFELKCKNTNSKSMALPKENKCNKYERCKNNELS